ncbi:MAG: hypothetical protein MUO40_05340 [Anaerolineaceae bacterium]|nr:hypothetical protein [Anaerolineaceae bacterium]
MNNFSNIDNIESNENAITLRCNKCGTQITPETAILTPTGYRCKNCIRTMQKKYETTKAFDVPVAFIIAAILAFFGSWLASLIGFFSILLAPAAGMLIAEAVRLATSKRRSKTLNKALLWGAIIGGSPLVILKLGSLLLGLTMGNLNLFSLLPIIYQIVFVVMSSSTAFYRFSGIRLR